MIKGRNILFIGVLLMVFFLMGCPDVDSLIDPIDTTNVDKTNLTISITDAMNILNARTVGSNPGDVSLGALTTFSGVIDSSKLVLNNESATQADVNAKITALAAAKTAIYAAIIKKITTDTYLYHSVEDSNIHFSNWSDAWDSGTTISEDSTNKILTLTSGTGWNINAFSVAWGNLEEGAELDVSEVSYFIFDIKTTNYSEITFSIESSSTGIVELDFPLSSGTVNGEWTTMKIPGFYFNQITDMKWIAIFNNENIQGSAEIKDIYFSTETVADSGPTTAAAAPSGVSESEAVNIFSNSLGSDGYWINYMDPWWNPPIFAAVDIAGNETLKYTIIPAGVEGGVVGLQFNTAVNALYSTTLHLDMFATAGVTKVQFLLVGGATGTYDLTSFTKDSWNSLDIDFSSFAGNFNQGALEFLGVKLWGTAGERVYLDNIYFHGDTPGNTFSVNVKDSSANVVSGASVNVGGMTSITDANGNASFSLPNGEFTITTESGDLATDQQTITMSGTSKSLNVILLDKYPAPTVAATNPTINNADANVIYSDSLAVDTNYISYWEDNWWNAPEFSEISIGGNNVGKFQIIPEGIAGGVTGIQFGVANQSPLNASGTTTMHFDIYITEGITKIILQLLSSSDGKLLKELTSLTKGTWVSMDIPYTSMNSIGTSPFSPESMEQLGVALYGTTRDAIYMDNIYFY